ncbi:zinc finger protein 366 isoform X2 [Gadus morhua]|nr:zinc finger protein 366 isoform X2 [Gadus morhua]
MDSSSPARSPPFRDDLRPAAQRGFYLSHSPLNIKPTNLSSPRYPDTSPSRYTFSRAFSPHRFASMFGSQDNHHDQKEGSQKRKKTPLKKDAGEGESIEREEEEETEREGAEAGSRKRIALLPHRPLSLTPPSVGQDAIPGMIDLNRLQLQSSLSRCGPRGPAPPVQVKEEPLSSPPPIWHPPPLFLHPPSPYFPPFHPSLLPFPFFLAGPIMHLSPGTMYPKQALKPGRRGPDGGPRGGSTTSAEKLGFNVQVDDSYYVDVGGDQKRWKCRMCEKSYTSKYNLITHILGHSGIKPHGCHLCGKLFKQLSHLHTHLLTHQGMRPHKCQVCHKAFTQTSHLKRHMMQHSDVKPYSCGVCGRGFAYPSELRSHELKHKKGQENVCVECGLDFPTLAQLKRHLTTHRGPTLYRCGECQKTFQYPSQLQNHMMKHKDIRPYICSECGMEFIQSHHLKQHTLTHKGVKEHKCRICGREFTLLANMKRHVLIHTNIRAYQCHMCFKSFVQKQTLKAHMIVHSDSKPYKCKLCGKEFNRMHNLMGHMHLHSDSKPFKCLYCPSKFTLKGNLTRHMKVKHGIMDRGLDQRLFRRRGRFCLPPPLGLLTRFNQEEPCDLSQKTPDPPGLHLAHSDGESLPGSSCQEEEEEEEEEDGEEDGEEEEEERLYSPEVYQHRTELRYGPESESRRRPYRPDRGPRDALQQPYPHGTHDPRQEARTMPPPDNRCLDGRGPPCRSPAGTPTPSPDDHGSHSEAGDETETKYEVYGEEGSETPRWERGEEDVNPDLRVVGRQSRLEEGERRLCMIVEPSDRGREEGEEECEQEDA